MKPQFNFMLCSHIELAQNGSAKFSSMDVFATMGLVSSLGVHVFNRFASRKQVE